MRQLALFTNSGRLTKENLLYRCLNSNLPLPGHAGILLTKFGLTKAEIVLLLKSGPIQIASLIFQAIDKDAWDYDILKEDEYLDFKAAIRSRPELSLLYDEWFWNNPFHIANEIEEGEAYQRCFENSIKDEPEHAYWQQKREWELAHQ